jgi:hypothetical protein
MNCRKVVNATARSCFRGTPTRQIMTRGPHVCTSTSGNASALMRLLCLTPFRSPPAKLPNSSRSISCGWVVGAGRAQAYSYRPIFPVEGAVHSGLCRWVGLGPQAQSLIASHMSRQRAASDAAAYHRATCRELSQAGPGPLARRICLGIHPGALSPGA